MSKLCKLCNKEFTPVLKTANYCSEKCIKAASKQKQFQKRLDESIKKFENADPNSFVVCKICGYHAANLTMHMKSHNTTVAEYYKNFDCGVESIMCHDMRNARSERVKGEIAAGTKTAFTSENNPGKNHGGKLSPFSKNFINYEGDEKIEKLKKQAIKTRKENNNDVTTLAYYTSRGYSEKDAQKLLSERQTTFSLEKCIQKHGEVEGRKIWQERQDKWMGTLASKSEEELKEITLKKVFNGKRSKLEDSVYYSIYDNMPDVKRQLCLKSPDEKHFYVFDIYFKNKIIEVNGDYWHGGKSRFKEDDVLYNGKSVQEIRERDIMRLNCAKQNGYDVMVIWESEFKKEPDKTIERCLEFLNES